MIKRLFIGIVSYVGLGLLSVVQASPAIGTGVKAMPFNKERGIHTLILSSNISKGASPVDVLLPDNLKEGTQYPVLYLLPVGGEWKPKQPFGNPIDEARRLNLHNRFNVICVSMDFANMPWYGSHATDKRIQHDAYLVSSVIPAVEKHFPAKPAADHRLLLGFSKSGWGAVSLILRYPEVFGFACSWDAPLAFTGKDYGKVGTRPHFGSREAMERVTPWLIAKDRAKPFTEGSPRIHIYGLHSWKKHSGKFAKYLSSLGIKHEYSDEYKAPHRWNSPWFSAVSERFLKAALSPTQ